MKYIKKKKKESPSIPKIWIWNLRADNISLLQPRQWWDPYTPPRYPASPYPLRKQTWAKTLAVVPDISIKVFFLCLYQQTWHNLVEHIWLILMQPEVSSFLCYTQLKAAASRDFPLLFQSSRAREYTWVITVPICHPWQLCNSTPCVRMQLDFCKQFS